MAKDAILNIIFGANTKELDKALDGATKRLRDTASQMNDVGKSLSIGLTAPIVAFGALATKNAVDSAKAIAQVEAAVKSTGGAAGRSVSQLEEMAAGLQRISLYDDDEILKDVTANLLTFTNVTGTQFDKAQVAILNLSTRLGTDLTSASVQVGKALNNPIKGVTALGRAGVQFTAEQKELITTLTESGDVAGAQAIILGELETQFGGAAEAAANADPYTQMANEVGNLSESFGAIINEALIPVVGYLQGVVDRISGFSDGTKKAIVVVGGLLAVAGPLLIAISSLISAYGSIKIALAGLTMEQLKLNIAVLANPYVLIGAAVVAAVALIIYNWDKIVAYFSSGEGAGTWTGLKESFDVVVEYVQAAWTAFVGIIQMIWDEFGDNFLFAIQNVMDLVMRVFRGIFGVIGNLFNAFSSLFKGDWRAFLGYIGNITVEILQMVVGVFLGFLSQVGNAVDAVLGALGVDSNIGGFLKGIQQTSDKFFESIKYKGDEATAAVTDFSKALDKIPAAPVISKKLATPPAGGGGGGAAAAGQRPTDMVGLTARGPAQVPNALPERGLMAPTDNTALVAAFMNEQAVAKARENLLSIQQILDNLGSSMAQVGEQFGAALGGIITGAEGAAEAMKGVARAAIDAAFNAATALAIQAAGQTAVGSGPAAAIVLPALITAGMGLIKSVFTNLVGLATGGLTTGPMLAMIGDNPSGKEAVIPFERMGEFLDMAGAGQSQNVVVTGRISGNDILLTNDRASRDRSRIRGF
jgi:hypothetical protein